MHYRSGCTIMGDIHKFDTKAPLVKQPKKTWKNITLKERSNNKVNNPTSNIPMKYCHNTMCSTNIPLTQLKKYGATYTNEKGYDVLYKFETEDFSTFKDKYDTSDPEIFNEIYDQCVDYKERFYKILNHKLEIGHLGYLKEELVNGDMKLCCPYCGSTSVVMGVTKKKELNDTAEDMPEHADTKLKVKQRHPITKEWVTVEVDVAPNPECDGRNYLDGYFWNKEQDKVLSFRKEAKEEEVYDYIYNKPLKPELSSIWPLRCFKFQRKHKRSIDHTLSDYMREMVSKDISISSYIYDSEPTPHTKFYHKQSSILPQKLQAV